MKQKWLLFIILSLALLLTLSACTESSDNEVNEGTDEVENESEDSQPVDEPNDGTEETEQNTESSEPEDIDQDNTEDRPQAVAPSTIENTIEFTRIWWTFGAPSRKPNAGIWLYTEDEHPSSKKDTFSYDKHDYLLYQIGNEEYLGYSFRAQRIVLEDDDVVRIIVRVHQEPNEDADPNDLEMPRQYLEVEKGALRGKAFIVETEDGEVLSLE